MAANRIGKNGSTGGAMAAASATAAATKAAPRKATKAKGPSPAEDLARTVGLGDVPPPKTLIEVPRINLGMLEIRIVGMSQLIVHAWSAKAIRIMEEAQAGGVRKKKEPRNPKEDYEGAKYVSTAGWEGVPSVSFKAALVGACRQVDGLPMTMAKRILFVERDGISTEGQGLVRIEGEARMRRDMVRLESGVADLRYRPEYSPWAATLRIRFNKNVLTHEAVANLVEQAGQFEGIGEWRPSSPKSATGEYGLWSIDRS